MSQDQDDYNNLERQRELRQKQDAFLLQQEERLKAAQRQTRFAWLRNTVLLLVGTLELLLALRFFLRLSGANVENQFASLIYNLSDPFVAPFSTLFISPTDADARHIFDLNTLIALIAYAVLGTLAVAILNYLQGRSLIRRDRNVNAIVNRILNQQAIDNYETANEITTLLILNELKQRNYCAVVLNE